MSWVLWLQIMIMIFWTSVMTETVISRRSKYRREEMEHAAKLASEAVNRYDR